MFLFKKKDIGEPKVYFIFNMKETIDIRSKILDFFPFLTV